MSTCHGHHLNSYALLLSYATTQVPADCVTQSLTTAVQLQSQCLTRYKENAANAKKVSVKLPKKKKRSPGSFLKLGVPFWSVLIVRIILFWGLIEVPLFRETTS